VLGVLILDERFGVTAVAGLLAILGGSWLATGSAGRPRVMARDANRPPAP